MISVSGLTKYYGDTCAVSNISFEIADGEIIGFLGLNGAGKTTTLRILACLLLPSSGTVSIGGVDIARDPHAIRRQVGFLPEEPPLYREMTVEAYLRFAGELRGLSGREVKGRLDEVLKLTRIDDVRKEVIDSLSYGYRKRVGIAQALVHRPPVLILDEPISGLDPVQIAEMRETIRGLRGQHTVLVSSHILPEISQTCDRILVIQDGAIVATGTEEELTSRVTGGKRLSLLVRGDKNRIAEKLRGLPDISAVEVLHASNDVVELLVSTGRDQREAISRALVEAGFGLMGLMPAEPELESIFIQLTRRHGPTN